MKVNIKTLVLFSIALSLVWMGFLASASMVYACVTANTIWESFWSMLIAYGIADLIFFSLGIMAFIFGICLLMYLYFRSDKLNKT